MRELSHHAAAPRSAAIPIEKPAPQSASETAIPRCDASTTAYRTASGTQARMYRSVKRARDNGIYSFGFESDGSSDCLTHAFDGEISSAFSYAARASSVLPSFCSAWPSQM